METKAVSKKLLERLPLYLNYIKSLPETTENMSATAMAKALGLSGVLVRKDLAQISEGGRRKLGYVRSRLIRDLEEFLDVNSRIDAVVVGLGQLGQALIDYDGFEKSGLHVLAGFDIMPPALETESGKPLYAMNRLGAFCRGREIPIGIIAVPAERAQTACDKLLACNIKAIWNFSSAHLTTPDDVFLLNENLEYSLTAFRLQLRHDTTV